MLGATQAIRLLTEPLSFQRRGVDGPETPKAAHENGTRDASLATLATDPPAEESEPEWLQNSWQQAETQEDVIKILASRCAFLLWWQRLSGSWGNKSAGEFDVVIVIITFYSPWGPHRP